MTDELPTVHVRFEAGRIVLERHRDGIRAPCTFPASPVASGPTVTMSLEEALHASIRPLGTAEAVLRAWARGTPPQGAVAVDDPTVVPPRRVRAGAIVIRDGRMLLIGFEENGRPYYEIPGGGVEEGETPEEAVLRELLEETGLSGSVTREVGRIWKDGQREHYFLTSTQGEIGPAGALDTHGGTPIWVPVQELPVTPVWPRRLAWRIAHWHRNGFPAHPIEVADTVTDLYRVCDW